MPQALIHRFELDGHRYAIDPETCFCFECDEISWDVLEHYPHEPINRIYHLLGDRYDLQELEEVVGELAWLRGTRSILQGSTSKDLDKEFQLQRGLKKISVQLRTRDGADHKPKRKPLFRRAASQPAPKNDNETVAWEAIDLLLNRSGQQRDLHATIIVRAEDIDPKTIASLCEEAFRRAKLASKSLTAAVRVTELPLRNAPDALSGHDLRLNVELRDTQPQTIEDILQDIRNTGFNDPAKIAKAIPMESGVRLRATIVPGHPEFGEAVQSLRKAGFNAIEVNLDSAYAANPELNPAGMLKGLRETAVYYANALLKNDYFRLDPIASLFWRIYDGRPLRRNDPAGVNELALDADGNIYPSYDFIGNDEFRVGNVSLGEIDDNALAAFDTIGATTTAVCRKCWARNLCGGGSAAVHQALSGDFRRPHEPWCDTQRAWMTEAVSAFNILSMQGVNFTRIYQSLDPSPRPSLFNLVRAAMRMSIALRPVEESDAQMLVRWENWTEAAYFLYSESGMLLATEYDREMASLHPQGPDTEMIITRKDGTPIGLFRVRPWPIPGAAWGWVYMRDPKDYDAADVRKGFRALLEQAGNAHSLRRLVVPAMAQEAHLCAFLETAGFELEGTQREALFLHRQYHDVQIYGAALENS